MKFKVKTESGVNLKYFCADAEVRYWEDAAINGEDDISYDEQQEGKKPRMPLVEENPNSRYNDDKWIWKIKIDLETGDIVGWPLGVTADVHYKVCDQGIYWLEDDMGNEVHKIDCYVPEILEIGDDYPDGDYIIFTIDERGRIEDWKEDKVEELVNKFLDTEAF